MSLVPLYRKYVYSVLTLLWITLRCACWTDFINVWTTFKNVHRRRLRRCTKSTVTSSLFQTLSYVRICYLVPVLRVALILGRGEERKGVLDNPESFSRWDYLLYLSVVGAKPLCGYKNSLSSRSHGLPPSLAICLSTAMTTIICKLVIRGTKTTTEEQSERCLSGARSIVAVADCISESFASRFKINEGQYHNCYCYCCYTVVTCEINYFEIITKLVQCLFHV